LSCSGTRVKTSMYEYVDYAEHTFSQLYTGSQSYYMNENGSTWRGLQQIHMD